MSDGSDIFVLDLANFTKKPKLLLGHIATTTCFDVNGTMDRIISSDRDGRIRVSKYPKTYDIINFAFLHEEFVSSVKFLEDGTFVSTDGDGKIARWTKDGKLIASNQLFGKNIIIGDVIEAGSKLAVFAENVNSINFLSKEDLSLQYSVTLNKFPMSMTMFHGLLVIGCNGSLGFVEENQFCIIEGFEGSFETLLTKENFRVSNKRIVHKEDRNSDLFKIWRNPELVPEREERED
jgi:hypothetical protein